MICQARHILAVIHENPDGDAWASLSAFTQLLDVLGKPWQALGHESVPEKFGHLPNLSKVKDSKAELDLAASDLIVSLDCGSLARTGLVDVIEARPAGVLFMEIDHHPCPRCRADFSLRDTQASATAKVLYDLCQASGLPISGILASTLLTGLAADTGNFVYASSCQETMAAAGNLLACGARLDKIFDATWKTRSVAGLKLWGIAMSRLKLNPSLNLAYTYLTQADLAASGTSEQEAEDLAGFLSGQSEAAVVALIKEGADGQTKVSLRSASDEYDVGRLARLLGGGGHARAAGFSLSYAGGRDFISGLLML